MVVTILEYAAAAKLAGFASFFSIIPNAADVLVDMRIPLECFLLGTQYRVGFVFAVVVRDAVVADGKTGDIGSG
jgi:hypothetical protein